MTLKYPIVPGVMLRLPKNRPWETRRPLTALAHRPPPPGWCATRVADVVCTLQTAGIHVAIPSGAIDQAALEGSVESMVAGRVSLIPTVGGPGHLVKGADGVVQAPTILFRCGWKDMYQLMVSIMNQDTSAIDAGPDAKTKKSVLVAYFIFVKARAIIVTHQLRRILYPNLIAKITIDDDLLGKIRVRQETLVDDFHDLSGLAADKAAIVKKNMCTPGFFVEDKVAHEFYFVELSCIYKVLVRQNACESMLTPFENHLLHNDRTTLLESVKGNPDIQAYLEHILDDRLYLADT